MANWCSVDVCDALSLKALQQRRIHQLHCDRRGEYISIAADQRPPDPHDWDVESGTSVTDHEGQHDEDNIGRERGNVSGEAPTETD